MPKINYRQEWLKNCPNPQAFDDIPNFSDTYWSAIRKGPGSIMKNGAIFSKDVETKFLNIISGVRRTIDVPETAEHTIFFLGPSYVFGSYCEERGTTASFLQQLCNKEFPGRYAVQNYGMRGNRRIFEYLQLRTLSLKKNDIVLVIGGGDIDAKGASLAQAIISMNAYCQQKECHFCYFESFRLLELMNPSTIELHFMNTPYKDLVAGVRDSNKNAPEKYKFPRLLSQLITAGVRCFDLQPYINRPHDSGEIVIDGGHLSQKGNKIYAQAIFDNFLAMLEIKVPDEKHMLSVAYAELGNLTINQFTNDTKYLEWLATYTPQKSDTTSGKTIGSIVMNCNPFTLGHRFLIEEAVHHVDLLYIFVVQEDLSFFSFSDRLAMVKAGVQDLYDKVRVIPSGNFIISSITFPDYFTKDTPDNVLPDPTPDIVTFGGLIAPNFSITKRFLGHEPNCAVTNKYNQTMKSILPHMGIEVHEIKRKELSGVPISASLVRKHLQENNWEALQPLVPQTTFDYLRHEYDPTKVRTPMRPQHTPPPPPTFSVTAKSRAGQIECTCCQLSGDNTQKYQYAFYLVHNGQKITTQWYQNEAQTIFPCPEGVQVHELSIQVFVRLPGSKDILFRKTVTVTEPNEK